jgi:hypothetical protein
MSITCSSSGGAPQAALGILHAYYVSWLHQENANPGAANWHNTHAKEQTSDTVIVLMSTTITWATELRYNTKCRLFSASWRWASNAQNM